MPIPFLLFGDGPCLHSGLARIARDLGARLYAEQEELGIQFAQVGVDDPGGWHWEAWPFYAFFPNKNDYGRSSVALVVSQLLDRDPTQAPIVFAITDPARVYDLTRDQLKGEKIPPVETDRIWGYFPIDGHTMHNSIGGPAAVCVRKCERVLGYGAYGAEVLKQTIREDPERRHDRVSYLPHGIETGVFAPRPVSDADQPFRDWYLAQPDRRVIIGAVATNQPRKDLGLLFQTVAELKLLGIPCALWLHTDLLTNAWDIGELAVQCRLAKDEVFVSLGELQDTQLAARYSASTITIAPGLGEGFGYPIVESLSCGTPVVHGNYAGGVNLIPMKEMLVEPVAWRLESIYALQRPVFKPRDVAEVASRLIRDVLVGPETVERYCRGSVAHLDWRYLWPRWRGWIRKGLPAPAVPKELADVGQQQQ